MKADLLLLTGDTARNPNWEYGAIITASHTVKSIKQAIDRIGDVDGWLLVWDAIFTLPSNTLIEDLISQPIDAWHSGLRAGLGDLPGVLNYVDPTWMYNKSASDEIEHTNFRLSLGCLLVKKNIIKELSYILDDFLSIDMAGVALGYAMLKSGVIIRYTPSLLNTDIPVPSVPLYDEWVFAKKFYTTKWHWWLQFTMPGFVKNMSSNWRTSKIKRAVLKPSFHHSDVLTTAGYKTVSVLAPTLDRYEYLLNELEQLAQQSILPVEVLITDQTPAHRKQSIPIDKYPTLDVRYFPQNETGQCVAWNKLLEEAKGEYVLFLGDDADDITPDFIERLLSTIQMFRADMVASNVIEAGAKKTTVNHNFYLSDTFPITLIKTSLLRETGFMDMFYNKNIRADHDLAMRCHLQGALMIFNPTALIYHHRAPVGGLRTHKARVVTNSMVKKSLTKFTVPTSSEIYLVKKFYTPAQYKSFVRIKFLNQVFIEGGILKQIMKAGILIFCLPVLRRKYKENLAVANTALA